jgi:hypothetical protein
MHRLATLIAWWADRPRRNPKDDPEKSGLSAYDLMCRSWYGLTCRGQAGRSCHVRVLSSNRGEPVF